MSPPNGATATSGIGSSQGKHVTVALSTIIAAIWAGIWGFNWAATHLSGDQLLSAILVGLMFGTAMTIYMIERTFSLLKFLRPDESSLTAPSPGQALAQTLVPPPPPPK